MLEPSAPRTTPEPVPPKPRSWRWLRELGLVVLVVLGVRLYQQRGLPAGEAPDWRSLADTEGVATSLRQYRGAPLMLHFWATWCGVCKAEQHNVVAVAADLPVLTVAVRSGPVSAVQAYLTEHPLGAKVLMDPAGELAALYGVHAFPTSFFLDGQGRIRHAEVGYTSELGMRVRMWLAGL
jgi:thiol-disulfide isomerase/thioredoxin